MKHNVLVFPCGTEIGLEIYRSLNASTHFNVFGGSSIGDHGQFVYKNYIGGIPYVNEPGFTEAINRVIKQHSIDFIIPAHDSVLLQLAQAAAKGQFDCPVVTAPIATCEITRSKLKTYKHFEGQLAVPRIYDETDAAILSASMPIFLKPDVGQGSKGIYLAKTAKDVAFYKARDPSLLLLEYLPGAEYTVDCFTNKKGELLFAEGRERSRISNGISVGSHTVSDVRFKELAEVINRNLELRGVWFFQVKERSSGELVLMEIAPRVAGTMGLVRCKGVNLVLLSLFDRLDYNIAVNENDYQISIDRALENKYRHDIDYEHAYIDFDDLVIFNGQVNPAVMAFVYQCVNKKVKTHLITRHKDDLDKNLKKYRLKNIFDEVIWVRDSDEKHTYITAAKAIFIDDSFAERQKVSNACKIPVFDSHMLESLMEVF